MGGCSSCMSHDNPRIGYVLDGPPPSEGFVRDALYTIAETVRVAAAALQPILTTKSLKAMCQLGAPPAGDLRTALRWGGLVPGAQTVKTDVLFPRIEDPAPAAP